MQTDITATEHTQTEQPVDAGRPKKRSRKRNIIIFTIISLLNAGLLALLWSQLLTPAPVQVITDTNGTRISTNDPLLGKPAPDFTLAALSSKAEPSIHLASLKGKPLVINFWASWCGPCADEAPLLQTAWQHGHTQGVTFIGIDYQDTQSAGLSFLQQHNITYPSVIDPNGDTAINYGVTGTPETFFIDRQGVIVATVRSQITAQQLQTDLALLTRL
jgi:cytochrome c biogenesis protein CcmG/thiol:disulfide interchange protein DsbE